MKKLLVIGTLIICLLSLVSCAKPSGQANDLDMSKTTPSVGEDFYYEETDGGISLLASEERMIVRTGDIALVVEGVVLARDEIATLAVSLGGYVVSSRISGEEDDIRGWISIRVADENFEQALNELRNLAVRVTSESTNSQDITEEYIDLQARLSNAEATESQYLNLLESATDVEDILGIYERLSQVRREIEQIKGQMQYLERTSSMSLITTYLEPEVTTKPLLRAGWSVLEVLKSAVRGLFTFGQWLGTIAIWLLVLSPVWGTILGVFLWRYRKRRA